MRVHDSVQNDIFSSRPIAAILAQFPDIYPKIFKADSQYRQGPVQRGVEESYVTTIWGHTQDVWAAVKNFPWKVYGHSEKDREEAEMLAFSHDLVVETHGKDYTPQDCITPAQKENEEREWKQKFVSSLGPGGDYIGELWEKYQSKETSVAQLVGQLDKLVAVNEAWILESSKPTMRPGFDDFSALEFFQNVNKHLKQPFLRWVKDKMFEQYNSGTNPEGVFHELLQSHPQFLREEKQRLDQISATLFGPRTKEYEADSSPEGLLDYELRQPTERPTQRATDLRRAEKQYADQISAHILGAATMECEGNSRGQNLFNNKSSVGTEQKDLRSQQKRQLRSQIYPVTVFQPYGYLQSINL